MLKKAKKLIQKDLKKRYDQLEERFVAFERRLYSHLEERLEKLENQFDQLSEAIRERNRILQQREAGVVADAVSEDAPKEEKKAPKSKKKKKSKSSKKEKQPKAAKEVKEVKEEASKEDKLTSMKGLGDSLNKQLIEQGVTTFQQIANLTDNEIIALNEAISGFKARYERYNWKEQARMHIEKGE